jgi:O-antigen/teichoic acid export membrane protein
MAVSEKSLFRNILFSALAKATNMLCLFISMPITLKYVSGAEYGLWLTVYSILSWFSIFDFGLSNGLKNKLTTAIAEKQPELAARYISTTYFMLAAVASGILLLATAIILFANTEKLLNIEHAGISDISMLLFTVTLVQLCRFVLEPIMTILISSQKTGVASWLNAAGNVLSLIVLIALVQIKKPGLIWLGISATLPAVIVILTASFYLFKNEFSIYKPAISLIDKALLKDILALSGGFFIVQMAGLIIFSTDNLIILRLFSAEDVVPYNVSYRYFSVLYIGFAIVMAPFWPAFTASYAQQNLVWIKKSIGKLVIIWIVFTCGGIILLFSAGFVYEIWMGKSVVVPFQLSMSMLLFVAVANWNNIFANFLNGVSKIRLQTICAVIIAILNIPLSIFFARHLNMGVSGVMFATCACLLLCSLLQPIQYYFIINNRAKGIWNK